MTPTQLAATIGSIALFDCGGGITTEVEILNAKKAYGNDRFLVKPTHGTGQRWVDGAKLSSPEER